jgi:pilus assembly protein Flp/PilA
MGENIMSNMIVYYCMAAVNKLNAIKSQKGVTMIEYALLAALIAVAVITVLGTVGDNLNTVFTNIANALVPAAGGGE